LIQHSEMRPYFLESSSALLVKTTFHPVSSREFSLGKARCCKVPVAVCETFADDFSAYFRALLHSRERRAISINLTTKGVNLSLSLSLSFSLFLRKKRHAWEAACTNRSSQWTTR